MRLTTSLSSFILQFLLLVSFVATVPTNVPLTSLPSRDETPGDASQYFSQELMMQNIPLREPRGRWSRTHDTREKERQPTPKLITVRNIRRFDCSGFCRATGFDGIVGGCRCGYVLFVKRAQKFPTKSFINQKTFGKNEETDGESSLNSIEDGFSPRTVTSTSAKLLAQTTTDQHEIRKRKGFTTGFL